MIAARGRQRLEHNPHFARVCLREKRQLLAVMVDADPRLLAMAWELADARR